MRLFFRILQASLSAIMLCTVLSGIALAHTHHPAAARSFNITVENNLGVDWNRIGFGLYHGIWQNNGAYVPPEVLPKVSIDDAGDIHPGIISFGSESNGFATGTEGYVTYSSNRGTMTISWDNPYVGSNSFNVSLPPGYHISPVDASGNNASVTISLQKN